MSANVTKIGLGLGALTLTIAGAFFVSKRVEEQRKARLVREFAQFRGLDAAGVQSKRPNLLKTPFVPHPTPIVIAPCEPVFSPDSRYVACRQPGARRRDPNELYVFKVRTGEWKTRVFTKNEASVELFWPQRNQLVLTGIWGQSWKVKEGRAIPDKLFGTPRHFTLPKGALSALEAGAHPENSVLVTNLAPQHDMGVRIWARQEEGEIERVIETFDTRAGHRRALFTPSDYHPADVNPFSWSPQGSARLLVNEFTSDFELRSSLWDPRTGRQLWSTHFAGPNVHLEWTPNGRYLVATRVTGSLGRDPYPQHESLLIDARNGHIVRKLKAQNSLLGTSVSNQYLASFGFEKRPGQKVYSRSWGLTDLHTGQRVLRCWGKASPSRVEDVAISSNNRYLAGTSKAGFMLWSVAALRRGDDKPQVLRRGGKLRY